METWDGPSITPGADGPDGDGDAALVRMAQRSPCAFEPIYHRYRAPVLAYCYRRLRNRDDAEDAASAAFVAALRGLATYRDQGSTFRAWLFTIVRNEVAMHHRRDVRHPVAPIEAAGEVTDPTRSPEEWAVRIDDHLRLAALLQSLPVREREVLELRLADLTTGEIAEVLKISTQNVRTAAVASDRQAPSGLRDGRRIRRRRGRCLTNR